MHDELAWGMTSYDKYLRYKYNIIHWWVCIKITDYLYGWRTYKATGVRQTYEKYNQNKGHNNKSKKSKWKIFCSYLSLYAYAGFRIQNKNSNTRRYNDKSEHVYYHDTKYLAKLIYFAMLRSVCFVSIYVFYVYGLKP